MTDELHIHHQGRQTHATAYGGEAEWKKIRNALLLAEFRITAEDAHRLDLQRRAYLTQDDWPMQVRLRRQGRQFTIDYCLYIPWSWIAAFTFLMLLVLPFAGIPNAPLAFGLALVVLSLAAFRQRFDCRPNARFWQQRPRQRWGALMGHLLREALSGS